MRFDYDRLDVGLEHSVDEVTLKFRWAGDGQRPAAASRAGGGVAGCELHPGPDRGVRVFRVRYEDCCFWQMWRAGEALGVIAFFFFFFFPVEHFYILSQWRVGGARGGNRARGRGPTPAPGVAGGRAILRSGGASRVEPGEGEPDEAARNGEEADPGERAEAGPQVAHEDAGQRNAERQDSQQDDDQVGAPDQGDLGARRRALGRVGFGIRDRTPGMSLRRRGLPRRGRSPRDRPGSTRGTRLPAGRPAVRPRPAAAARSRRSGPGSRRGRRRRSRPGLAPR